METHDMALAAAGSSEAVLAACLCLVASLFFAFRRPAANAFLNLSLVGVGGAPLVGGVTYGRISAFVGLLTVLVLLLQEKRQGAVFVRAFAHTPLAWFAGVWLLIFAKILIETAMYGPDFSRTTSLTSALTEVVFPVTVFILGASRAGPEATGRDLLVGMATFPLLVAAGYLPFVVRQGLLASALRASHRLSLWGADYINSARVLAYGAIAMLMLFPSLRKRGQGVALSAAAAIVALSALMVLTGTRQYLLALAAVLVLRAIAPLTSKPSRRLIGLGALACVALVAVHFLLSTDLALKGRLSVSELQTEASENRGLIWRNAFEGILEHPVLGAGFKNFGTETDVADKSGGAQKIRDTAHGGIQDVFTEHGIFLGLAFLAGCLHLVAHSWQGIRRDPQPAAGRALALGLVALLPPLLFSSAFLNMTPLWLLLAMSLARDTEQSLSRSSELTHLGSVKSIAPPPTLLRNLLRGGRSAWRKKAPPSGSVYVSRSWVNSSERHRRSNRPLPTMGAHIRARMRRQRWRPAVRRRASPQT